jgi:protein-tyrosine phosphatase
MDRPFRVLFVCMGNICRSPTAQGVLREKLRRTGGLDWIGVDSAGTHDYHVGAAPDPRSQRHALARGYDLSDLRARELSGEDYARADLLLTMDDDNLATVERRCPPEHRHKVQGLTQFCRRHADSGVPDPYAGGAAGFERVLDLVEDACDGLLLHIARTRSERPS